MKPLIAIHEAIHVPFDAMAAWLWDAIGLKRLHLVMIPAGLGVLNPLLSGVSPWLMALVCGVIGAQELMTNRKSPAALNLALAMTRSLGFWVLVRLSFLGWLAWDTLADAAAGRDFEVRGGILCLAYFVLSHTYHPDRPRKPRREPKLALAGGLA